MPSAKTHKQETADDEWKSYYQQLVEYRRQHGHCVVPQRLNTLGRWVSVQRRAMRKLQQHKSSSLNAWKIEQLEQIDFVWWVGVNGREKVVKQMMMNNDNISNNNKRKASLSNNNNVNNKKKQKKASSKKQAPVDEICTSPSEPNITTELNDHDLELARLIANFPHTPSCDQKQQLGYQEMMAYLNTITTLQEDIFHLQQELFETKSTIHKVQSEYMQVLFEQQS